MKIKVWQIILIIVLCIVLIVELYFLFFNKDKENNPCKEAICNKCNMEDGKKVCNNCNIFNEKEERIWTGSCIFDS